ncbi:MAG: hypothetical protein ACREGF_05985 [Candidatus Saccharimonadales bacterium]
MSQTQELEPITLGKKEVNKSRTKRSGRALTALATVATLAAGCGTSNNNSLTEKAKQTTTIPSKSETIKAPNTTTAPTTSTTRLPDQTGTNDSSAGNTVPDSTDMVGNTDNSQLLTISVNQQNQQAGTYYPAQQISAGEEALAGQILDNHGFVFGN